MIAKYLGMSLICGTIGWNGLFPADPPPMTPYKLRVKAIEASKSQACKSKKKTPALKEFCKKREERA